MEDLNIFSIFRSGRFNTRPDAWLTARGILMDRIEADKNSPHTANERPQRAGRLSRWRLWLAASSAGALVITAGVLAGGVFEGQKQESSILEKAAAAVANDDGKFIEHTIITGTVGRLDGWRSPDGKIAHYKAYDGDKLIEEGVLTENVSKGYSPRFNEISIVKGDLGINYNNHPEKMFDDLVENGKVLSKENIKYKGKPAIEVVVDLEGPSNGSAIKTSLIVDSETYLPLKTSHKFPGDEGPSDLMEYEYEYLPNTPENRKLLEMDDHPGAKVRVEEVPAQPVLDPDEK